MTPLHSKEEKLQALSEFLDVLDTLREQCPWDAKQTNESLRPNTIEEVFELADALIAKDTMNIRKELGDVLLHVAFYARIGEENGQFDIADVCNSLVEKLKYRHPHIYGNVVAACICLRAYSASDLFSSSASSICLLIWARQAIRHTSLVPSNAL